MIGCGRGMSGSCHGSTIPLRVRFHAAGQCCIALCMRLSSLLDPALACGVVCLVSAGFSAFFRPARDLRCLAELSIGRLRRPDVGRGCVWGSTENPSCRLFADMMWSAILSIASLWATVFSSSGWLH